MMCAVTTICILLVSAILFYFVGGIVSKLVKGKYTTNVPTILKITAYFISLKTFSKNKKTFWS